MQLDTFRLSENSCISHSIKVFTRVLMCMLLPPADFLVAKFQTTPQVQTSHSWPRCTLCGGWICNISQQKWYACKISTADLIDYLIIVIMIK